MVLLTKKKRKKTLNIAKKYAFAYLHSTPNRVIHPSIMFWVILIELTYLKLTGDSGLPRIVHTSYKWPYRLSHSHACDLVQKVNISSSQTTLKFHSSNEPCMNTPVKDVWSPSKVRCQQQLVSYDFSHLNL